MSLLGIVGLLLSLLGLFVAPLRRTRLSAAVFAMLFLLHIAATIAYYQFSLANVTDSGGYYHDYDNLYHTIGFGLSTVLITFIVQFGRETVGGSFLDWFFVFQSISFLGICYLMRTIEEIYQEFDLETPFYAYLPLFLPGIHFWTSPIGKDGILFLGSCLAIWAAMNLKRRWIGMAVAIFLMMIIRPHIAIAAGASIAAVLFFDRRTGFWTKTALMACAGIGLVYASLTFESLFGVDLTSADAVSEFLAAQAEVVQISDVAGNSAVYGNYPFKLFSLLFRPFFVDAEGVMGLLASAENACFALIVGVALWHMRTTIALAKTVSFVRFALVYGVLVAGLLALVYYNIGLGLRQKTMFVPSFVVLFVAVLAVRQARRQAAESHPPVDPLHAHARAAIPAR